MSAGVWVFLGLVIVAIAILKGKGGGGAKAPEENGGERRPKPEDLLARDLVLECVRAAKALPIVEENTSWLLHDPVYDARTDQFDAPCTDRDFGSSFGRCWLTEDTLHEVFEIYAGEEASFRLKLSRPRTSCVVVAADHIDVLRCHHRINEPGLYAIRLSRVAENRWHHQVVTCGMAPGGMGLAAGNVKILLTSDSDGIDPPIKAVDVAEDPTLWIQREEKLRGRWKASGTWREAARLCAHKPQD